MLVNVQFVVDKMLLAHASPASFNCINAAYLHITYLPSRAGLIGPFGRQY
jgi:hypothetical protein